MPQWDWRVNRRTVTERCDRPDPWACPSPTPPTLTSKHSKRPRLTTSFDLDLRSATPTILGDGTRKYLPGDPSAGYDLAGTWQRALADQLASARS